ncbi:MAG: AMP-binding protein, partial [Ignavibacteria bacterium]|nr:AMP-binding protein [Ignavibacteria bacterium]
ERDHIALISENRVQWGLAYLAAVTFNFVIVPIDKNLKENEILTILHASDSKVAIFSESFREMFLEFRSTLKDLKYLIDMDLEAEREKIFSMTEMIQKEKFDPNKDRFPKIEPNDVSVIVFTSGSMGRAKGVMLSQKNIASNIVDMRTMIELFSEDRFLSVLPIHHTYECTCGLLCPLSAGSSVHYARSLKTVVEDIQKVKATILLGVPLLYEKMYRRITKAIEENKIKKVIIKPLKTLTSLFETIGAKELRKKIFHEIHDRFGGHIRIFIVGGAAPDPQVAKGLRSFGFNFIQGYGLTETSPILALNRLRKFKDEAAGLPLPRVQIKIENPDEEGRGEVVAKGPNIMLGYYKNEEATNQVLKDGWFYTGDFGFIDNDGFLHICGRKKNVIIAKNGKNVFPEEIEDQIKRIPYVLESVVYGYKNNSGDEEIGVMIVPNAEEFIEYSQKEKIEVSPQLIEKIINDEIKKLNKELPIYKQIRTVKIQEREFEKTTTQKIKRYLINQEDSVH